MYERPVGLCDDLDDLEGDRNKGGKVFQGIKLNKTRDLIKVFFFFFTLSALFYMVSISEPSPRL